jgi:hypothetical protein
MYGQYAGFGQKTITRQDEQYDPAYQYQLDPTQAAPGPNIIPNNPNTPTADPTKPGLGGKPMGGAGITPAGSPYGGDLPGLQSDLIYSLQNDLLHPTGYDPITKQNMFKNLISRNASGYANAQEAFGETMQGRGLSRGGAYGKGMGSMMLGRAGADASGGLQIDLGDAEQAIKNKYDTRNQILGLLSPWYQLQSAEAGAAGQTGAAAISASVGHERNAIDMMFGYIDRGAYGTSSYGV